MFQLVKRQMLVANLVGRFIFSCSMRPNAFPLNLLLELHMFSRSIFNPSAVKMALALATVLACHGVGAAPIVAASDVGYPPFSFSDPAGGYEGIDIDIANALAKQIGEPIKVIDQPWATTFAGLNAKKFDLVLSPTMISKERAASLLFAQAYGDATYQFVLRKDGTPVNSPDDLKGKTIAVNKGNLFDKWLTARQDQFKWKISRYDKNSDAIQAVASGQADAALVYSAVVGYVSKQNPMLVPSKYVINEGEVYAYAFRKDDPELRNKVDMALQCLKQNGTIAAIYKKWTGLEPLAGGATMKVSTGAGQPGFEGYDPTPRKLACK
jgi:polar amino acid transport system substrate-binding protein